MLNGGIVKTKLSKQQEEKEKTKERQKELTISKVVYGKRVTDPILGNFYSVPKRDTQRHEFQLDTSFAYVSVLFFFCTRGRCRFFCVDSCVSTFDYAAAERYAGD